MTTISITRLARCKDCAFLLRFKSGKRIRHKCSNQESPCFDLPITLKDYVCDEWKLTK